MFAKLQDMQHNNSGCGANIGATMVWDPHLQLSEGVWVVSQAQWVEWTCEQHVPIMLHAPLGDDLVFSWPVTNINAQGLCRCTALLHKWGDDLVFSWPVTHTNAQGLCRCTALLHKWDML